jgi:hypothetical protein
MTAPPEIAGLSLEPPRLRYEIEIRPWGACVLERPHAARGIEHGTLALRLVEGDAASTFEMKSFVQPAVQPYYPPPPAVAWRALLVEHALLARPELIWSGAFPVGFGEGLAAPWVAELRAALEELHRRYASRVRPLSMDYSLRQIECAECHAARLASVPAPAPHLRFTASLPPPKCPHGPAAMRALGELCEVYPELTFEVLGWMEPAGARVAAEGPTPSRFVLTGPLVEAVLGPWLLGDDPRAQQRMLYRGYDPSRRTYRPPWTRDPPKTTLHRGEVLALGLAGSAWGYTTPPEAMVVGSAPAGPTPTLEPGVLPELEVPLALPGARATGKAARARATRKKS